MPPRYSDSRLIIDLKALAGNYSILKKRAKNAETAAVVKADAYGLGAAKVAIALKKSGCRHFFVATLDEAIALRDVIKETPIYVFHGVQKNEEKEYIKHKLIPVLNHPEQAARWQKAAKAASKKLPAILHVDTGMHRLGFTMEEAEKIARSSAFLSAVNLTYVMSHLACASESGHPLNKEQLKRMNAARKLFPGTPVSFANSAGIFMDACYHFDLVRPGVALYGVNSTDNIRNKMKPVAHLKARIIELHRLEAREPVGYGATETLPQGTLLATVPVGYSDGYLRSLSSNAQGFLHGRRVPLVGRVSMDLIVFDVTSIENKVKLGDEIELLGNNITVDELAQDAGTIGYEILTRLGSRFIREYKG